MLGVRAPWRPDSGASFLCGAVYASSFQSLKDLKIRLLIGQSEAVRSAVSVLSLSLWSPYRCLFLPTTPQHGGQACIGALRDFHIKDSSVVGEWTSTGTGTSPHAANFLPDPHSGIGNAQNVSKPSPLT